MQLFFHHTRPVAPALEEWKEHKHPGHIFYGITHFWKYGITYIFKYRNQRRNRILVSLATLFDILFCKEPYDILYGSSFRGIEFLVFLRSVGLYKKPIVVWHHTAVTTSKNKIRECISKLFYKGFDKLFFFNSLHIQESLATGKVKKEMLHLIHWGADLDFYDYLLKERKGKESFTPFISTGQENRDFKTLTNAFIKADKPLKIYTKKISGTHHYQALFDSYSPFPKNINITYVDGIIPYDLAQKVVQSEVVTICCLNYPYPVGSTTLVEAMALGKPIIASSNPYFGVDIEKEHIGISVAYGDTEGWERAIKKLSTDKELADSMGNNSRLLAEKTYNLEAYTAEIVPIFISLISNK